MYPKDKKYRLGKKHSEGEQKEFSTWQKLDKYARSNLTPKIILFSFLSVIFAVILSFFLILWTTYNPRIQNKIQQFIYGDNYIINDDGDNLPDDILVLINYPSLVYIEDTENIKIEVSAYSHDIPLSNLPVTLSISGPAADISNEQRTGLDGGVLFEVSFAKVSSILLGEVHVGKITKTIAITLTEKTVNFLKDSDGDGLSDLYEAEIGTDPKNMDSDGDGVTDSQEISYYGTDPNINNLVRIVLSENEVPFFMDRNRQQIGVIVPYSELFVFLADGNDSQFYRIFADVLVVKFHVDTSQNVILKTGIIYSPQSRKPLITAISAPIAFDNIRQESNDNYRYIVRIEGFIEKSKVNVEP